MVEEEREEVEEGAPLWMATFSDLATLLLTFFVLMLSFANLDVKNFKTAMGSVRDALGVDVPTPGDFAAMSGDPIVLSPHPPGVSAITIMDLKRLAQAAEDAVEKMVEERELEDQVEVVGTAKGIILRTRDNVLFNPGSDEVETRGREVLELVADLLESFEGELEIQGHTDDIPIHTGRFRSNWELSSARATSVLRDLQSDHGVPVDKMHVAGYADTRPVKPPPHTAASRALNRRVEFVFEYPVGPDERRRLAARAAAILHPPPPAPSASVAPVASSSAAPPVASASAPVAPSAAPSAAPARP